MADTSNTTTGDEHRQDFVTVTINDLPKEIHRGRRSVAEIKNAGGIALADDLEQLLNGKLTGLADGASVTIKGGEIFVSHPKDSSSSQWATAEAE